MNAWTIRGNGRSGPPLVLRRNVAAARREVKASSGARPSIGQRMMVGNKRPHPLFQHMGVDLRCRNVGMTQKHLHSPEIGAIGKQMRGEGVAQHMRRYRRRIEAGRRHNGLQLAGKGLAGQVA